MSAVRDPEPYEAPEAEELETSGMPIATSAGATIL